MVFDIMTQSEFGLWMGVAGLLLIVISFGLGAAGDQFLSCFFGGMGGAVLGSAVLTVRR